MRGPGQRIREICEALERLGEMTATQLMIATGQTCLTNTHKYCVRAADLGMVVIERGGKNPYRPNRFAVVPNWRELADRKKKKNEVKQEREKIAAKSSKWYGVNSVFAMGGV